MGNAAELNTFNWQKFLAQWSHDFIAYSRDSGQLSNEILESGWLGYPGATDEQIAQAEARLNVSLPLSYREFLKVTNGWRQTTPFIYKILPVEKIDWFINKHYVWIHSFVETQRKLQQDIYYDDHQLNGFPISLYIPNEEYFRYGESQDCKQIRYEYLTTALEISDKGESAIYLLNPKVTTSEDEWEAWFFCDDLPGADRYRSFQEMMVAEYENFLEMIW